MMNPHAAMTHVAMMSYAKMTSHDYVIGNQYLFRRRHRTHSTNLLRDSMTDRQVVRQTGR